MTGETAEKADEETKDELEPEFEIEFEGETDVKEEEDRHPVKQISDELKADMVNECVEKLVSPKDIEMTEETAEKAEQETKDEGVEGETDVKEEEERHPVQQISDELKADMVNECVEKIVSPKDIAADMHVEELGDAVETLEVLPTSTIKPIKVTLVRSIA